MFLDIAETSVEQCETRYKEMVDRNSRDRYPQPMFSSEFIAADCTKVIHHAQVSRKSTLKFNIIIIITKLPNFAMLTANNKQTSILR